MTWIYVLVSVVLVIQVLLFVAGRRIRKQEKENNVLLKYDINTRQQAWQLLADPNVPEEDKAKIKEIYDGDNE